MTERSHSRQRNNADPFRLGRRGLALTLSALVTIVAGSLFAFVGSAQASAGCHVDYQVAHEWPGGFVGDVTVTNDGDAVDGWTLTWAMADGQDVSTAWNATVTVTDGQASATNVEYNAAVSSGGSVTFGFLGTWTTSNPVPTAFSLNGTVCGDTADTPTTSTTSSATTTSTTSSEVTDEDGYFVSPSGNDSAAGTKDAPWATLAHAQAVVGAGDTVYVRGGTYAFTAGANACTSQTSVVNAISLDKSGSQGNPIRYQAYPGETPVFDFSQMTDDCRIKGFNVTGSWIHLTGLEISGVRQNNNLNHESWGVWVSGSNNTFEQLDIHNIMGAGLFIANGGGNLVLNSDSHDNDDPLSSNGAGENADGFGAHIRANNPGNVFRGCRAWSNTDDGFDLINAFSSVTIENSWAWKNGFEPGTTTTAGNGIGFKIGGYGGVYRSDAVKHTVRFSVAFSNRSSGFYANHHPLANDYFNNTSYDNHPDYNMLGIDANGAAVNLGNLRNNIAYGGSLLANISGTNAVANSWNLDVTLSNAQFRSVSTSGWDAPRQADGSLPVLSALHLASGSSLIDAGVDVGLPYNGSAPDLGAFET